MTLFKAAIFSKGVSEPLDSSHLPLLPGLSLYKSVFQLCQLSGYLKDKVNVSWIILLWSLRSLFKQVAELNDIILNLVASKQSSWTGLEQDCKVFQSVGGRMVENQCSTALWCFHLHEVLQNEASFLILTGKSTVQQIHTRSSAGRWWRRSDRSHVFIDLYSLKEREKTSLLIKQMLF